MHLYAVYGGIQYVVLELQHRIKAVEQSKSNFKS